MQTIDPNVTVQIKRRPADAMDQWCLVADSRGVLAMAAPGTEAVQCPADRTMVIGTEAEVNQYVTDNGLMTLDEYRKWIKENP